MRDDRVDRPRRRLTAAPPATAAPTTATPAMIPGSAEDPEPAEPLVVVWVD